MSVQFNQYMVYGYMLPYKETKRKLEERLSEDEYENMMDVYHDSAYKQEIVEINGCSCIIDGMGGKYIFFGKIYAKSENYYPLNSMTFPKVTTKIKKAVEEEFKKVMNFDTEIKPQLQILTHYR